jgi:hypothetical protein
MPENIYIGNFGKGLTLNPLPFNLDNDAFPTLFNVYVWRKRALRKRGTSLLGQLQRQISISSSPASWQYAPFSLSADDGNLLSNSSYTLQSTATIAAGTVELTVNSILYTDPNQDGTLIGGAGGSINYSTGAITISGGGSSNVVGTFGYYPGLSVLGLEDYVPIGGQSQYPMLIAFDQTYAYQLFQTTAYTYFYSVSYYKITGNPVVWSGQYYQQFWSTNYQNAFWATNNKPGFHFVNGSDVSGSGTTFITFTFKYMGSPYEDLIIGDVLWFNEWSGSTVNGITGIVSNNSGASSGTYIVKFTASQTVSGSGIAQLLTNSIAGQDGIRWYDGDPTGQTGLNPNGLTGWVNFAPPLTAGSVSIDDETSALYYLVGALIIIPYKDRLLFFSPYIQTSAAASLGTPPIQLIDTVIWSWNGTPYYTTSTAATTTVPGTPSVTPDNETADVTAYYVDQTGKGGYLSAGIAQAIITVSYNEDVVLVGFTGKQTRFVYTGNDIDPFRFFVINSEFGSSSTFSAITVDRGAYTLGIYGIVLTTQQSSERIDLEIPDSVFQIQNSLNGTQTYGPLQVNAVRDFYREWIYIAYPVDNSPWKFPTQTFFYNYRDNTWAIFYENFTAHGTYRRMTGASETWASLTYFTWSEWTEPWNAGSSSALFPSVIAGTPQGYVLIKDQNTAESVSGTIWDVADNGEGNTRITSYNHCVLSSNPNTGSGDYLYFQNALGATFLNGQIGQVIATPDADTFDVDISYVASTYIGLGQFARLSQPLLQTKQFAPYWNQGRQVVLGVQRFLMDATENAQITLQIYLSQNADTSYSDPANNNPPTNALIYTQTMFTCPESSNIGLTPANVNLQMPTALGQAQIWHRTSTGLVGDSFQIGLTLSDAQMRDLNYATSEIVLHAMHLQTTPGPSLA